MDKRIHTADWLRRHTPALSNGAPRVPALDASDRAWQNWTARWWWWLFRREHTQLTCWSCQHVFTVLRAEVMVLCEKCMAVNRGHGTVA